MKAVALSIILLMTYFLMSPVHACVGNDKSMVLNFDRPAGYFEEAFVIGNGNLGAIVYGQTGRETISLNDITLWTGEPESYYMADGSKEAISEIRGLLDKDDYSGADLLQRRVQGHYSQNYQPLGTLNIDYSGDIDSITDYYRQLDISEAIASVSYVNKTGRVEKTYFASAPDSVIIVRLKSASKSGISAIISFDSQLPHSSSASENEIKVHGYAAYHSFPNYWEDKSMKYDPDRGIHFRTQIKVKHYGGNVKSFPSGCLKLDKCSEVVIYITNVTSFNGFDKDPVSEGRDYCNMAQCRIDAAYVKSFDELRDRHVSDYRYYFDRVELELGSTEKQIAELSTDRQLLLYSDDKQYNPDLEELYFQYGRYLLISCSRTPGVPANLQGLWNESILPPWSCNYTTNINLEENYWAAESANLSEMHRPLLEFISNLSVNGKNTAKDFYGVDNGWCLGHNSDIWAMTCPVGLQKGDPSWACWTMGGAWLSTHIWEHYLFTKDKAFLKENYHALKGAAEFCMNWLIEKNGFLMTSPGTSPENKFITPGGYVGATSYGNTSDMAIIKECLIDTRKTAKELGTDNVLVKRINEVLERLVPYQVGKKGNLQEWYHDWEDEDPRHRHQSHMIGLYPGHHLSPADTPELMDACRRTLEIKGDETTGWSTGWRINLYARLHEAQKAYNMYRRLLRYVSPDGYNGNDARRGGGTYPNLLDAHSPFQIDGNFGGCAGVIEMIMQSSLEEINLLPALPDEWKNGHVKGICARGGFVIDMEWKDGKVTSLYIKARTDARTVLKYKGKKTKIALKGGEKRKIL